MDGRDSVTWRRWKSSDVKPVVLVSKQDARDLRVCRHCLSWTGPMVRLSYSNIYHRVEEPEMARALVAQSPTHPMWPQVTRCGRYFYVGLPH
jgi:hypothetical protein